MNILCTVFTDYCVNTWIYCVQCTPIFMYSWILCTVFTDYCVQIWCFMLERFLMFSSCNFSPDSFRGNLSRVFWFIMIPGFQAYSSPDNTPDTTRLIINYFNYFHQEMFTGGLVPEAYTGGGIWGSPPPPWISKFYGFQGFSSLNGS